MAFFEDSRSLRDASCCRVLVVKGALGRLVYGFSWTLVTATWHVSTWLAMDVAVASSRWTTDLPLREPSSLKSRPMATRLPSTEVSRAVNWLEAPSGVKSPSTSQYEARTNAIRSRSRSTTMRVATDCTRPADRPALTLRHSTGLT